MRTKTTIAMVIFAIFTLCLAASQPAVASDEEDVLKVATTFFKAITTNNFELVSSLWWHSPKASSYEPGTVPFLIEGWDNVSTYWQNNLSGSTEGSTEETGTGGFYNPKVTMVSDDSAYTTGCHVFTATDPVTKNTTTTIIRQSLFIQKINGKWLIVHAHASMLPTE